MEKLLLQEFYSEFPYVDRKGGKIETLWEFLNQHPPIISLGHGGQIVRDQIVVYEAPDSEEIFMIISNKNYYTYQWMFTNPFQAAGGTHCIAVDLQKLAQQ